MENKSGISPRGTKVLVKPFTVEEVVAMMGVTSERIRQIESKALKRLQQKKRKNQLRDFSDESDRDLKYDYS